MFKRFMFGLITGLSIMYYYLYHYQEDFDAAAESLEEAASGYRGDRTRQQADELIKK